eukprot:12077168-Alexandrium_andersonii.AAC.1
MRSPSPRTASAGQRAWAGSQRGCSVLVVGWWVWPGCVHPVRVHGACRKVDGCPSPSEQRASTA